MLGAWMTKPPEEGVVTPTGGMPEVSNKTMRSGKRLSDAIKLMVAALATVDSATRDRWGFEHSTGIIPRPMSLLYRFGN